MYCAGNERLQKTKREEGEQCAQKKFCNPGNFYFIAKGLPSATPAKQRTKFMRICKGKTEKIITKTKLKIKELCKTINKTEINKKILNKILGWPISLYKDHTHTG